MIFCTKLLQIAISFEAFKESYDFMLCSENEVLQQQNK